jgi:hypothetical protein
VKPRPFFTNPTTAKTLGWFLFITGALVLYDAYDRRGGKAPWPMGAVLPF